MATINLIPNKRKTNPVHSSKQNCEIHKAVYNTGRWKKLRMAYISLHPVCEICDAALAVDVHHKKEISKGTNRTEYKQIGFDENNLMAVCKDCHKSIHNKN